MNRCRRDLLLVIAFCMSGATTLQELTRGILAHGLVPTLLVACAVALGLRALVLTFEVRDRQAEALVLER